MENKQEQAQDRTGEEVWTELLLQVADVAAETCEWRDSAIVSFLDTTFETKEQADTCYWQMVKPHECRYEAQLDILTNVFCVSEDLAKELVSNAMNRRAAGRI